MEKLIYLHDIPQTVLADKTLLGEMLENCIEAQIFGLTIDIFLDGNQFIKWVENLMNGKLSVDEEILKTYANNFLKDNPDFLNVELEMDFFNEHLKKLKEIQSVEQLVKKDNLLAGFSIEELDKLKETREKSYALKLETATNHYNSADKFLHLTNIVPFVYKDFENFKESYFANKYDHLTKFTSNENVKVEQLGSAALEHNKNHWNKNCYNLFLYLVDNYEKKGKVKYTNIHFYLKHHADKNKFVYNQTIETYTHFINLTYGIELKTFRKAEFEFLDHQVPIMNDLEGEYCSKK